MSVQLTFDDLPPLPPRSRADQIKARFKKFHKANPEVWILFQQFADDIIRAGYKHYSVDAIFERIRWHVNIETRTDEPVKLNNDYRAYYARMYAVAYPTNDRFFRTRKRTSTLRPASENGIAVFNSGEATGEGQLMDELRDLL